MSERADLIKSWLAPAALIVVGLILFSTSAQAQTPLPACSLDLGPSLTLLFQAPSETVLGQWFALGFTTLISAYFVAYLVGVLVSMFDK